MKPTNALGNRNARGIVTLSVCALLVLTHCDSGFVPDVGPPPNSSDARAEKIKAWYDTALEEEQNAHLDPQRVGKLAGDSTLLSDSTIAAVLAAMVGQHPPDWDQMETWDNGSGGYIGATLLAGGLGTASDPNLSVVRTLVADVDEDGRVLSGYLVEFVSEDAQESQFKEYVEQWLTGDFGNKPMLVAEYTVGYASTSATFYAPGKAPRPITMQLVEKSGPGKTAGSKYYCYVSGRWEIEMCEPYMGDTPPDDHVCASTEYLELTCVLVDSGDGDGDGGECPNGCGDTGGSDGGDEDDDDSDDDDDTSRFRLSCTESVTTGESASCSVSFTDSDEQATLDQFLYTWSSSTGATLVQSSDSKWEGTATESATINVKIISEGFDESDSVGVVPESAPSVFFKPLNADTQHTADPKTEPNAEFGFYKFPKNHPTVSIPHSGSGPWTGRGYISTSDEIVVSTELHILEDFKVDGPKWPDARTACPPRGVDLDKFSSNSTVNTVCGTYDHWSFFGSQILAHEREHESNYNLCLTGNAASNLWNDLATYAGQSSEVGSYIFRRWGQFWKDVIQTGEVSAGRNGSGTFWVNPSEANWVADSLYISSHGGSKACSN